MSSRGNAVDTYVTAQATLFGAMDSVVTSRAVPLPAPFGEAHLLEVGSGDPLLLVHGGGVAAQWAPLVSRMAPDFRLVIPDKPGAGLASPFDYRGVNLREHGTEFLKELVDALGLDKVSIVGNSMGGYFAFGFALAHPDRVSKLVIAGEPAGSADATQKMSMYHRLVGTRGLNALLFKTVLHPRSGAEGARAGLARGRLVAKPDQVATDILECFAAGWELPGAVRSWYTMLEQAWDPPGRGIFTRSTVLTNRLVPELGRLAAPTLFLWGDQDPLASPAVGRSIAAAIPNAQFQLVEDAGHLVYLDQPDVCGEAITTFLRS